MGMGPRPGAGGAAGGARGEEGGGPYCDPGGQGGGGPLDQVLGPMPGVREDTRGPEGGRGRGGQWPEAEDGGLEEESS